MKRDMGTPLVVTVERPVAGGDMLARHDGGIVFLRGVIPGERVRVQIVRRAKGVAWADVVAIEEASPDRREPTVDPACGGGTFAHIAPARQVALKGEILADAFRRIAKHPLEAPPAVAPSPEHGYRVRARLHVRHGRIGFFREQSHALCDAATSGQLSDDAVTAARALVDALGPHLADVEAIVVAENIRASERVLHLEPRTGARIRAVDTGAWALPGVTGVTTVSGGGLDVLAGRATVTDHAKDLFAGPPPVDGATAWTRHATSFFQGNRFLAGALVSRVLEAVSSSPAQVVADCYAGVGLFAVAVAATGAQVVAVEGDASSGADLAVNAKPFGDGLRVVASSVEAALATAPPASLDVAIVDPPRTGMTPDAVRGLVGWGAARLVYVSCDPPTLARDARVLLEAGYRLTSLDAFDLFPNTPHVEALAVFER